VPERHRGWVGGTGFGAAGMAYLLASLWFIATSYLFPGQEYLAWGWRVMFFTGLMPLIILFYVNYLVPESYMFLMAQKAKKVVRAPMRTLFSREKGLRKTLAISFLVTLGWALLYYLTQGTLPTFLLVVNHLSMPQIGGALAMASVGMLIGPIIGGELSQHIGRRKVLMLGSAVSLLVSFLYLPLASLTASGYSVILVYVFLISFFVDLGGGVLMTFLNESFPTEVRGSGVALTWNVGFAVGGAGPLIVTSILAVYGMASFPIVQTSVLLGSGVIALIGRVLSAETRGRISQERKDLARLT
jgi:predicted MFS family arabinose efflux permease